MAPALRMSEQVLLPGTAQEEALSAHRGSQKAAGIRYTRLLTSAGEQGIKGIG